MNKTLRNIITTICILLIVWFIGYFLLGDFISLEFANYSISSLFPKILTFAAAVSVYVLFLLMIKRDKGWSFMNIMKFVFGIIVGLIPLCAFEYYSLTNCADWKVEKTDKKVLFQSVTSASETIKLIEYNCPDNNMKSLKVRRIMTASPLFILNSPIDTLKISDKEWKKIK